jgi:hypothetical protein
MHEYTCEVTETIAMRKLYTVEARNLREAKEKIAIGDTFAEAPLKEEGVTDREPHFDTLTVK